MLSNLIGARRPGANCPASGGAGQAVGGGGGETAGDSGRRAPASGLLAVGGRARGQRPRRALLHGRPVRWRRRRRRRQRKQRHCKGAAAAWRRWRKRLDQQDEVFFFPVLTVAISQPKLFPVVGILRVGQGSREGVVVQARSAVLSMERLYAYTECV